MSTTTEDVARLVVETLGAEGIEDLRQKLATIPPEMGELAAAFGRGEISLADYDNEVKRLKATHQGLSQTLGDVDKAFGKAKSGMAGLGQAGLQTGRIVQDFAQGGLGGVLNNIEGFTQAVGGGPGLAGAMTVLGIAFYLAKPYLQDFAAALGDIPMRKFIDEIDVLKEHIKTLEDKKVKLAVDYSELSEARQQLAELQKDQAEYDAQHRPTAEKEAGGVATEMLADSAAGEDVLKGKVQAKIANDLNQRDAKLQAALKEEAESLRLAKENDAAQQALQRAGDFEGAAALGVTTKAERDRAKAARERARLQSEANEKTAEQETGGIFRESKERGKQGRLAEQLRGVGEGDLATMLEVFATPQAARDKAEEKAELARQKQLADRNKAIKEHEKKEADAQRERDRQDSDDIEEGIKDEARLAKAAAQKSKAALHKKAADDKKIVDAQTKDTDQKQKVLEGTDIDERAAVEAAAMRARGGYQGSRGFVKLSPEQQEARLRQMALQEVKRAMPGLNPLQAGGLASRIASDAGRKVDEAAEQARVQLAQQGVRGQQLGNAAMGEALGAMQRLLAAQQIETAKAQQLGRAFRQVSQQVQERTRSQQSTAR